MKSTSPPIALIGYRGAGKTTVARELAKLLDCPWIDADDEIERRAGKSIAAIFADEGEASFRDWESQVVQDLCSRSKLVVALGGGAILREQNRQAMVACRAVVWLQAAVDAIAGRLAADATTASRRPNLTNTGGRPEIERLLAERTPIYRACATLEVDTDGRTPSEIAGEIVAAVGAAD